MVTKIDVSHVDSREQLHQMISTALRFPNYYGNNWDAFDECAADPNVEMPQSIIVIGIEALSKKLPREAESMRKCFADASAERMFAVKWEDK